MSTHSDLVMLKGIIDLGYADGSYHKIPYNPTHPLMNEMPSN